MFKMKFCFFKLKIIKKNYFIQMRSEGIVLLFFIVLYCAVLYGRSVQHFFNAFHLLSAFYLSAFFS